MKPNKNTNTCTFCASSIKVACFAESENFRAIYNIAPILPGHCLIIPNTHISSFQDIAENDLFEMVSFSRKIMKLLKTVFKNSAFDWTIQDGIAAGQTVEHFHLHIIPRKEKDLPNPGDWHPLLEQHNEEIRDSLNRNKFSQDELRRITDKLRKDFEKLE